MVYVCMIGYLNNGLGHFFLYGGELRSIILLSTCMNMCTCIWSQVLFWFVDSSPKYFDMGLQ